MFAEVPGARQATEARMAEAITKGARLTTDRVLQIVSPSYRRIRRRLAMLETCRLPATRHAWR